MTLDETLRKAAADGLSIKAALEVAAIEHEWIDRAWLLRWRARTGVKIKDGRGQTSFAAFRRDDPVIAAKWEAKRLAGYRTYSDCLAAEKSHSGA